FGFDTEHGHHPAETEEGGAADREVEDLVVAELGPQPGEEVVVDAAVDGREALGVLDGELLAARVERRLPELGDLGIELLVDLPGEAGGAVGQARGALVELCD